jgi:anti-sigma-K factor RskA
VRVIGYGHAMSERDTDFSASTDNSAIMDSSRSTAEFRAFADRPGGEPEQPWSMRAPGRKVAIFAGIVVAVAIVLALIAIAVLNA